MAKTKEERSAAGKAWWASLSPEQRAAHKAKCKAALPPLTPERREKSRQVMKALRAKETPEQRRASAIKAAHAAAAAKRKKKEEALAAAGKPQQESVPMDRKFDLVNKMIAGERRVAMQVECGGCGVHEFVLVNNKGRGLVSPMMARQKFIAKGWEIGSRPKGDRCPKCAHPHVHRTAMAEKLIGAVKEKFPDVAARVGLGRLEGAEAALLSSAPSVEETYKGVARLMNKDIEIVKEIAKAEKATAKEIAKAEEEERRRAREEQRVERERQEAALAERKAHDMEEAKERLQEIRAAALAAKASIIGGEQEGKAMSETKAAPPREMSREDRRVIFARLQDVYVDEKTGYSGGWSDKRVAEDLGVPRAWVENLREENFGPAKNNEEVEKFMAEITPVMNELRSIHSQVEEAAVNVAKLYQEAKKLITYAEMLERRGEKITQALS